MEFLAYGIVLVAVFCKDDAPSAENYVNKSYSKKCQILKNVGRNSSTQPCYFGKLLIIIPAFLSYYWVDFLSLDIPTTADVMRFGKNLKYM